MLIRTGFAGSIKHINTCSNHNIRNNLRTSSKNNIRVNSTAAAFATSAAAATAAAAARIRLFCLLRALWCSNVRCFTLCIYVCCCMLFATFV